MGTCPLLQHEHFSINITLLKVRVPESRDKADLTKYRKAGREVGEEEGIVPEDVHEDIFKTIVPEVVHEDIFKTIVPEDVHEDILKTVVPQDVREGILKTIVMKSSSRILFHKMFMKTSLRLLLLVVAGDRGVAGVRGGGGEGQY